MADRFFAENGELIASWRQICGFLADIWHWQPSELENLEVEEMGEWFKLAQDINETKAKAYKMAARG